MTNNWSLKDPIPGDMVRIFVNKSYYHYGVVVNDDEVVEFGHPFSEYKSYNEIFVEKVSLEEFCQGEFVEVRTYTKQELKTKRKTTDIINFALSKLGEGNYNLLYNNCEHFANLCVFGKSYSEQVEYVQNQVKNLLNKKEN